MTATWEEDRSARAVVGAEDRGRAGPRSFSGRGGGFRV